MRQAVSGSVVMVALAIGLMVPTPADAQAHLQLLGGVTNAADRAPFFAGGIGVRISFIEFDVEAGRFQDVLAKGVLDALNQLQESKGLPVQGIAKVPATYAFGSLRIIPGGAGIRPFVSGGFGYARLEPRIDVVVDGISFGDVFGLTSFDPVTKPMAVASAGLRLETGRVHVEGGYRYIAIFSDFKSNFSNTSVMTSVNAFYGALGVKF